MKLENEFTVNTSIDEAWKALNDLERVTPCLPGAQLTAEVGDEYEGTMTVKMGPVTQKYNGTVKIEDAGVHVLVETDMQLTGRVAQFGRGMHKEVASKIMGRFADCMEKELF